MARGRRHRLPRGRRDVDLRGWPVPAVRRFVLTHGVAVTRAVGVLFIAFGAKSLFDAARGLTGTVGRVFRKRFYPIKGLRRGFQPPRASAASQAIAS